jgi:hypothetical protein
MPKLFVVWDFHRAKPVGKPLAFRKALGQAGALETRESSPFLVLPA